MKQPSPGAIALVLALAISHIAVAQRSGEAGKLTIADSSQLAAMLGLDKKINQLRTLRSPGSATKDEAVLRQDMLESIQATALDVDSVLAEISNERAQLAELRFSLQGRRDRTVNLLNTAALLTGSALGAAVSATQFTALSSRSQNIGDGLGIGSGVASTVFALLAVRKQAGPKGSVGETPNMLAPLLDGGAEAVLSTAYPGSVMRYLRSIPGDGDQTGGTRLERLMKQWTDAGRLDALNSATRRQKVALLSTSMDSKVKISIDELTDRIAMLTDVSGRISLMKRDLAALLRACSSI